VLITLGRLASQERQKGFDEMIEILPELARKIPGLSYMIVGDGDDRPRLVQKASDLGLRVVDCAPGIKVEGGAEAGSAGRNPQPQVIFTGYVAEAEKADHYRAADLYVMPSRGEGFGIVYLEALACGLPVIGSKVDGSREALRDGLLGTLVDPADRQELKDAIHRQLGQRTQRAPEGLSYFSYAEYEHRCHHLIRQLVGDPKAEK
jgi:glycosyltransferase involved in cell wall biosynthesis